MNRTPFVALAVVAAALPADAQAPEPAEPPAVESPAADAPAAGDGFLGGRTGIRAELGVVLDGVVTARTDGRDRAEVREVEMNLGAPVDPYFDLFAQIAASSGGVEFEQGYAIVHLPWNLQARAGRMRLPFGTLNPVDQDGFPQVDRPHVLRSFFGDEGIADEGGSLEWIAPWWRNPTLTLVGGAFNGVSEDEDGDGVPDGLFQTEAGDRGPLVVARAHSFYEWAEGRHALRVGASYMTDENDSTGATRTDVWGIDLKYRWRPDASGRGVEGGAEYLVHRREQSPNSEFIRGDPQPFRTAGLYAWARYDWNRWWGVGYRYDISEEAFSRADKIRAHSIYLEWRPSEFSRVRLQVRRDDRDFDPNGDGNPTDADEHLVMLQGTYLIGWHPAHSF